MSSFFGSVFIPNAGKYGPEKTPSLDTFHAMFDFWKPPFFWVFFRNLSDNVFSLDSARTDTEGTSTDVIVVLIIVFLIIFIVLVVAIIIVVWLKKHKQPVNAKSVKELILNVFRHAKRKVVSTAVNVYNMLHNKKDENMKIKYANDEISGGSKINPGYTEHWISESMISFTKVWQLQKAVLENHSS